jgi:hypothetical protein
MNSLFQPLAAERRDRRQGEEAVTAGIELQRELARIVPKDRMPLFKRAFERKVEPAKSDQDAIARIKSAAESVLVWITQMERAISSSWDAKRAKDVAQARALIDRCKTLGISDLGPELQGIAQAHGIIAAEDRIAAALRDRHPLPWLRLRGLSRLAAGTEYPAALETLADLALPSFQIGNTPNPSWERLFEQAASLAPLLARTLIALGPILGWTDVASMAADLVSL